MKIKHLWPEMIILGIFIIFQQWWISILFGYIIVVVYRINKILEQKKALDDLNELSEKIWFRAIAKKMKINESEVIKMLRERLLQIKKERPEDFDRFRSNLWDAGMIIRELYEDLDDDLD